MIITVIGFIIECSECGMTLFLSIYNAKQCPDHVNYLLIKFIVHFTSKSSQVNIVISRNKLVFLDNKSENKLKVGLSSSTVISTSLLC
jgi:phosphomevalonate kinase